MTDLTTKKQAEKLRDLLKSVKLIRESLSNKNLS